MGDTTERRVRLRPLEEGDIEALVAAHDGDPASFAPAGDAARGSARCHFSKNGARAGP